MLCVCSDPPLPQSIILPPFFREEAMSLIDLSILSSILNKDFLAAIELFICEMRLVINNYF